MFFYFFLISIGSLLLYHFFVLARPPAKIKKANLENIDPNKVQGNKLIGEGRRRMVSNVCLGLPHRVKDLKKISSDLVVALVKI